MGEEEIMGYKGKVDTLVDKLISEAARSELNFNFDKKEVKPLEKPVKAGTKIYIVYNIPVEGPTEYLKNCLYNYGVFPNIDVELIGNTIKIERDTGYHNSMDLPEEVRNKIKVDWNYLQSTLSEMVGILNNAYSQFKQNLPSHLKGKIEARIKKFGDQNNTQGFLDSL